MLHMIRFFVFLLSALCFAGTLVLRAFAAALDPRVIAPTKALCGDQMLETLVEGARGAVEALREQEPHASCQSVGCSAACAARQSRRLDVEIYDWLRSGMGAGCKTTLDDLRLRFYDTPSTRVAQALGLMVLTGKLLVSDEHGTIKLAVSR